MPAAPMNRTLRVHVGLPKCASTALQSALAHSSAKGFVGKNGNAYADPFLSRFFRKRLVYEPSYVFDAESWAEELEQWFSAQLGQDSEIIVSDEILCGAGFHNYRNNLLPDPLRIVERLARIFSEVRILLFFRNLDDYMKSYYNQLIKMGACISYQQFVTSSLNNWLSAGLVFRLDEHIRSVRGMGCHVTALPLEASSSAGFHQQLESFFGLQLPALQWENVGFDQHKLWRKWNRNFTAIKDIGHMTPLAWYERGSRHRQELTEKNKDLFSLHPKTNAQLKSSITRAHRRLTEAGQWDLSELGYAL